ncbi:Centrosomal protein of 44 kDa, partial [Podochytrium sp. JEL0797]
MAATGDLRNNIAKVLSELKLLQYAGPFDPNSLSTGDPSAFLPLLHFVLLESDATLAAHFAHKAHTLHAKRDGRFVDSVYKLLRDEFGYKPVLSREQFFSNGFAERKLLFVLDVARLCRNLREDLARGKGSSSYDPRPAKQTYHLPTATSSSAVTENGTSKLTSTVPALKKARPDQHATTTTTTTITTRTKPDHAKNQRMRPFDPTKYTSSSTDILHELNESSEMDYPRTKTIPSNHHDDARKNKSVTTQNHHTHEFNLLANMPYRTALHENAQAGGGLIQLNSRMQNGDWIYGGVVDMEYGEDEEEVMGSGILLNQNEFETEDPSCVFPASPPHTITAAAADTSAASMLHEPLPPPNPSTHPLAYYPPRQMSAPSTTTHRRSILKPTGYHPDTAVRHTSSTIQQNAQQPPLELHDLQSPTAAAASNHATMTATITDHNARSSRRHNSNHQYRASSSSSEEEEVGEEAPFDMSTSATSGSRSLNHGVPAAHNHSADMASFSAGGAHFTTMPAAAPPG